MSVPFEHDAEIDPELMLDHVLQFRKYGSAECPLGLRRLLMIPHVTGPAQPVRSLSPLTGRA
ncbi:MAG: hypothetical protein R3C12_06455 [Planctomycetaceae bacterium]